MRNPSVSSGRPASEPHSHSHNTQPTIIESRPDNADEQPPRIRHGSDNSKPKRVRTGCLTCRERHLKCDEALPRCQNCSKSGRICKRGVRLNFIDTQTVSPPHYITPPHRSFFAFQDESREIASEYEGGFERYPSLKQYNQASQEATSQFDFPDVLNASVMPRQSLPVSPSMLPSYPEAQHTDMQDSIFSEPSYITPSFAEQSTFLPKSSPVSASNIRPYINTPEEALLMQVFVEEVGLWMDSMDAQKHFTEKLPFHALGEPMLLNSILACGARHLHLVNPSFSEDRALHYYNAASRALLSHLQDPSRDSVLCATTAVILNCYEVMCESAVQRMNHIAGARALIKECQWNGKTPGVGGACFWLNVGMELLSCLHFDWQMAWDPDTWGMDMESELVPSQSLFGDEESWTHRMVFICAKVANFRTSAPQLQGSDRHTQTMRLQQRCHEWTTYKRWCDEWAKCIPRSMIPMSYLHPWQTTSKSAFPEVWLIRRPAIAARLFYHTTCILLAKCHPVESEFSTEMRDMQQRHAHDLCGIVAHVKDRGVATMSIRCLAIAAECLVSRDAQEEILDIMDKIMKEAGWRIGFLKNELQEKWGWETPNNRPQSESASSTTTLNGHSLLNSNSMTTPSRTRVQSGIVNPLMVSADFSMPNHPYQDHYVAPQNHLDGYNYPPPY
ncbi:uncharacterized protein TRUGW13939_05554 [Talaromyces rugulosus]|uniref:Zn(2)-C6 fungal-type domain-containing protein n=1 Tax=Talaromyces rugulosus TaxID=121627 RepID=A0A7H8QWG8_TALRU|nr:uncharacterized protein TRUGW13939_05554 [Talaromyces rugulosus]QKX58432.1 hypothetical protein TRUGW13939_05554 [Talaromyces rugulosus]